MRTTSSVLSRTQRRSSSRQGRLTLLLLVVVSAACFLAGVVVGRWSAPATTVLPSPTPPPHITVTRPAMPAPVLPVADATVTEPAVTGIDKPEELTYYNTLTKGDPPPLGSGINLPPTLPAPVETEPAALAPAASEVPTVSKSSAPKTGTTVPSVVPATASNSVPASKPAAAASKLAASSKPAAATVKPVAGSSSTPASKSSVSKGSPSASGYVVQTAAFRKPEDAADLARRLSVKHYVTFVEAVELPGKGIWHRVYVGPYASSDAATQAADRLKRSERLSPVVKKR